MTATATDYSADYYLKGVECGLSNYENYRWMPNLTREFASAVKHRLHIGPGDTFLDFGCARGYLVKALRQLQVEAWGCDISHWAIENCDPEVTPYVFKGMPKKPYSHVFAKDVLEHIPKKELRETLHGLYRLARWQIFIVVPLTSELGGRYVREDDEKDVTHAIRWPFVKWLGFISETLPGQVWGSLHVEGIKPASKLVPGSTGFFRVEIV